MKRTGFFIFLMGLSSFLFAQTNQDNAKTSIAMLNYLGTQSVIIEQSKDNRLLLEEIFKKFLNNTNPRVIDTTTQQHLKSLMDIIDGLRLTTLQREKIQFIYENQKAQALSQSMPNPLYLLALKDKKPLDIIMTAAIMAVDSVVRYNTAKGNAESNLILANIDIQKEDLISISNLMKTYFNYRIDITRINNLDGSESLSEESINRFVGYILDTNKERTRDWLEKNQTLYAKYAPYWLALAEVYYDLGQYQECLRSVQTYESIQAPIFMKDFDLARVLPKAILSASKVLGDTEAYFSLTKRYLQKIKDNTDESDWSLRYFAAQTYISIAALNDRRANLQAAYDLIVENIIYLSRKQDDLQKTYANEIKMPSEVIGQQKKQTEKLVKQLQDARKTELPPMHSGLTLNYQAIFLLMDELKKTPEERNRVSNILKDTIVMPQFRRIYLGGAYNYSAKSFDLDRSLTGIGDTANGVVSVISGSVNWNKINIEIPATFLAADSIIDMSINSNRLLKFPSVQYKVLEVIRKKATSPADFSVKVEIPLPTTFIIEKDQEYILQITIKAFETACNIVFISPKGKTNFDFSRVE